MATITNLGFAITSSWDGSGMAEARRDIQKFQDELKAMSNDSFAVTVTVNGLAKAKSDIEALSKEVDVKVNTSADTAKAKSDIEELSKNVEAKVKVDADTSEALFQIEDVLQGRDLTVQVGADTQMAMFSIDELLHPRKAIVDVEADTGTAKAEIDETARERRSTIRVVLDGIAEAKAKIAMLHADDVEVKVTADTSQASGGFMTMISSAQQARLVIVALGAAMMSLAAIGAVVGAAMTTALGGGFIAAGIAAIAISDKMAKSQQQAQQAAQATANTANQDLANAYRNVSDQATKGAQSIADANRGVSDAQRTVGDTAQQGAQSIKSANEQSISANQSLKDSQDALGQAFKDSQRNLEDLQLQQSQTGDNAEAAAIAVARAQDKLKQGPAANSKDPALDRRANANELALAIDHQNGVLAKNKQVNEDANSATAKGVDGSDRVIKAKQNEVTAAQKAQDAALAVGQAQKTAAENNQKATEALGVAQQKAAQAQKDAAEANQKAAEQLVNAQVMATNAQNNLNTVLAKGTGLAMTMAKTFSDMAAPLRGPLTDALENLKGQLAGLAPQISQAFTNSAPLIQPFIDSVTGLARNALPGVNTSLKNAGPVINGFRDGLGGLGTGIGNMFSDMSRGSEGMGAAWKTLGDHLGKFLDIWGQFIGSTAGRGAQTLDHMLTGINNLTKGFTDGLGPALNNASNNGGGGGAILALFTTLGDLLRTILPAMGMVSGAISAALTPAIKILMPVVAQLAAAFQTSMLPVINSLAPVLKFVATVLGAVLTGLTPLMPVIGPLVAGIKMWTVAQGLLNLVMDANPIVLIGIAVAALVGGIIYLATKTQFFQEVWKAVWGFVKEVALAVWDWLKDKWNGFIDGIKDKFDTISNAIKDAWNAFWNFLKDAAKKVWDWIRDAWDREVNGWKKIWDVVSDLITGAWDRFWNGIKKTASEIWDGIKAGFSAFGDGLKTAFDGIVSMAKTVWDGIKKVFADPINFIIGISNDTIAKVIPAAHMDPVKLADGGVVPGSGGGRADDVPAMLSSKEFVTNAAATSKNLGVLHHINNGGTAIPAFADGGAVADKTGPPMSPAVDRALSWAGSLNGQPYNADGWIDCSGLASGLYDQLKGNAPKREFTTVSDFSALGFKTGSGGVMDIGVLPKPGDEGHMAITLAGHKIESGGTNGIRVDGPAWGADNAYFTDHYFLPGGQFNPAYTGPGADGKPGEGNKSSGGIFGAIGNAVSGVIHAARGGVATLFEKLTNPILSVIPDPIGGGGKPFGSYPKAQATHARDDLANLIRGHESSSTSANAPFGGTIPTGEHLSLIDAALALTNTPPPGSKADWETGMDTLIGRESGWNSAAINLTDSNAAAGTPSKGVTQTIDPTFNSFAAPGHTNIWEPVDNIAASINYIKSRYGNVTDVQQANANMPARGYATGTESAKPGLATVGENGPEVVDFKGGESVTPLANLTQRTQAAVQTAGDAAQKAGQNFLKANTDQLQSDLGISTDGSGFIPQLFTQSFNYGQQLASWAENKQGIFADANPAPAGDGQQGGTTQPTDVHFHADDMNGMFKQWKQSVKDQALGFDPFGNM